MAETAKTPPPSTPPPRSLEEQIAMHDELERDMPEDDEELSPEIEALLLEAIEDERAGRARPFVTDEELCARLGLPY